MAVEVRTDGPLIEVRIFDVLSNEDFRAAIFPDVDSARRWLALPGVAEPAIPWTPLAGTA